MTIFATNLLAFVIVLGFLIFVHEAGHFLVAKAFGVRVLTFSFGFGKRLFGFHRGPTDYRVSLIPLGGYVRMAGDSPEEGRTGEPDEYLSKPKWQRFFILLAGPGMNLIIAIAFMAIINMVGTQQLVTRPEIGDVTPGSPAAKAGLLVGDRIVRINNDAIESFDDLKMQISMHSGTPLKVEYVRNGAHHVTTLTPVTENSDYGPVGRAGIRPWIDPIVGDVRRKSPAEAAGMKAGDRIVSVDGHPVVQLADFDNVLDKVKGAAITVGLSRNSAPVQIVLPAVKDEQDPYRGFIPQIRTRKLTLGPAIKQSIADNRKMLGYAFTALGRIFRSEGSVKELSGPISIARISGDMLRQGWMAVVGLMAMISLQLGVMNLLPIPVLDGGHIFILLVEGAARRDLSLRVKERVQQLGFAVLAAIMIIVLYNDVISNVLRLKNG